MSLYQRLAVTSLVNVPNELGPVENASSHVAAENIVELCVMHPGAFNVVDLKFDIRGRPAWVSTGVVSSSCDTLTIAVGLGSGRCQ